MSGAMLFIILILAAAMLVVLIAKLASFLRRFSENTRLICSQMDRADSYEEYQRLRDELCCHYLTLIPFVTKKNVSRLHDRIFHRADRKKNKERKDGITAMFLPSILSICICLVCVCGMTWAWYTASIETPTQKSTAAYYKVMVQSVMYSNGTESIEPDDNGNYVLTEGIAYTITLEASGTIVDCGGYCLIQCDETKYYTQFFKPDQRIIITLTPQESGEYTFRGVWGGIPTEVVERNDILFDETNGMGNADATTEKE